VTLIASRPSRDSHFRLRDSILTAKRAALFIHTNRMIDMVMYPAQSKRCHTLHFGTSCTGKRTKKRRRKWLWWCNLQVSRSRYSFVSQGDVIGEDTAVTTALIH
jgi:hypothetical protein